MRQDISVNPIFGEINLDRQTTSKRINTFSNIGNVTGIDENYFYGEILVSLQTLKNGDTLHTRIPYIPEYKPIKIRLKLDANREQYYYNPQNNSIWFLIKTETDNFFPACTYKTINDNGEFSLVFQNGDFVLYSMYDTDLIIKPSLSQDKIFLLKATASNLYQHPKIGVGLIKFLHANFENVGLGAKLQQEFEADGLIIKNANINSLSGELYLEVEENNG